MYILACAFLATDGVYYPAELESSDFADGAFSQAGNAGNIVDFEENNSRKVDRLWNLTKPYDKVIISSELFWFIDYDNMSDIVNGLYNLDHILEIDIILYLRNQADYFESWYLECVESCVCTTSFANVLAYLLDNANITINETIKQDWKSCNYYNKIRFIKKALQNKWKLHIKNYNQLKAEHTDIIVNFFEIVGVNILD